jgi:hypothetical protein
MTEAPSTPRSDSLRAGFSCSANRRRRKLRIVHPAPIIDRDGRDPRAITGQDGAEIRPGGYISSWDLAP